MSFDSIGRFCGVACKRYVCMALAWPFSCEMALCEAGLEAKPAGTGAGRLRLRFRFDHAFWIQLVVQTAELMRITTLPLAIARSVTRRVPILTAAELVVVADKLIKHPAHVLLALAVAGGSSTSLWALARERAHARGLLSFWVGLGPLCLAALISESWVRPGAHLIFAFIGTQQPRWLRMAVYVGVRLALQAAVQPLLVISRQMILAPATKSSVGHVLSAIVKRDGLPGLYAGLFWRQATYLAFFASHVLISHIIF